jgi:hypothetical protein
MATDDNSVLLSEIVYNMYMLDSRGFSIAQILIIAALISALGVISLNLFSGNMDYVNYVRMASDATITTHEIQAFLSDQNNCTSSFAGADPSGPQQNRTKTQILRVDTGTNIPMYVAGTALITTNTLTVDHLELTNDKIPGGVTNQSNLRVYYKSRVGGLPQIYRTILVEVAPNNTSPITNCIAIESGNSLNNYIQANGPTGTINIPTDGMYLLLAKGTQVIGDNTFTQRLFVSGNLVETVTVGDYADKGVKGGGSRETSFVHFLPLKAGNVSYALISSGPSPWNNAQFIAIRFGD